ncbi:HAD family hydrolase [Sinomonas atrocyanea]
MFLDIGGPVYDDVNFLIAVTTALDELRSERGMEPVPPRDIQDVYDTVRARQSGSIRSELARRFLGGESARAELSRRTRSHWHHPAATLMPDVLPFMEALHGRTTIGLVANQEPGVVDDLHRDGIAPYIDIWGISALVGIEKPSPLLFQWALDQAGVKASEAVHIGNRLDTDVRPAHALGIGTVWVVRGEAPDHPTAQQRQEADLTVDSLVGLPELMFP